MSLLDFILNVAGLLFWLSWRSGRLLARNWPRGVSLASTIKPTEGSRAWISLASLFALLAGRAFIYWNLGAKLNWTAVLDLVAVSLAWRSDHFLRMLVYSFASFGLTMAVFYSWVLLLSVINRRLPPDDRGQRFVRVHLGILERLPPWVKLSLPFAMATLAWVFSFPILSRMGMVPALKSHYQLWEQGLILGASSYLAWKWVLLVLLPLYLLNTYIYLGEHPFWKYVSASGKNLLGPLKLLRIGSMDLSPIVALGLVWGLGELVPRALNQLFRRIAL